MGTLTNSEDPDLMNNRPFHHGHHCFLRQNQSSVKDKMDHPDFTVLNYMSKKG